MSDIPDTLWSGSSLKETGKAFQDAIAEALRFRPELDRDDPIQASFLAGLGYLLNLADNSLAYRRLKGFKRDLPGITAQARAEIAGYRKQLEEQMVKPAQIDEALTRIGINERTLLDGRGFHLHLHLRAQGLDSRFNNLAHEVTVPREECSEALRLEQEWLNNRTDPVADGVKALRLWRGRRAERMAA